MLRQANIPEDAVGLISIRLQDRQVIASHRADASMQPASTLKLLTTLAGLETLGPTFRGRAELRANGAVEDGVLKGNVILVGKASPDFGWESLRRMLIDLRDSGVKEIQGDLIVDRDYFTPSRPYLGLPDFDETPEFQYNVIPDALLLNMNLLQLDIESTSAALRTRILPSLDRVRIANEMQWADRACADWEDGWKLPTVERKQSGEITITLRGEFPRNCKASTSINILDRTDFADRLFRSLWQELGGKFSGVTVEGKAPSSSKLIAEHRSRTLAEMTRDINKRSDNPMTRLLFLTMGAITEFDSTNDRLPTSMRAEQQVRGWLRTHNIDDSGLVLENGSGLSRTERIRPSQLMGVLLASTTSSWQPEFAASLPIVGVDGAMRQRLHLSAALQRGRIKTGSLRDVAAIAGFLPDARGKTCAVVAMINHPLASGKVSRPILDAFMNSITESDTATKN